MQQISVENLFLIDIETVSVSENFAVLTDEWKELWTEKIAKALPDNTTPEEYYPKRAGIMAEFAKVVCISIGYIKRDKGVMQLRTKSFYLENEKEILEKFIDTVCKCRHQTINGVLPGTILKSLIFRFYAEEYW